MSDESDTSERSQKCLHRSCKGIFDERFRENRLTSHDALVTRRRNGTETVRFRRQFWCLLFAHVRRFRSFRVRKPARRPSLTTRRARPAGRRFVLKLQYLYDAITRPVGLNDLTVGRPITRAYARKISRRQRVYCYHYHHRHCYCDDVPAGNSIAIICTYCPVEPSRTVALGSRESETPTVVPSKTEL